MKTIIAGSRELDKNNDPIWLVADAVYRSGWLPRITEIVTGGCRGIDVAGAMFADNYKIPVKEFLPDWDKHGKAAGPIRNKEMAEYADALILIWDGRSKGSASMLKEAQARNLRINQYLVT